MPKLGIICGSAMLDSNIFAGYKKSALNTDYGAVDVLTDGNIHVIQRHGKGVPPHRINHKANIQGMKQLGISQVIAICSCGSLKKDIKPGMMVIIDDYMQLWGIPTFFDDEMRFTKPYISENLRKILISAAKRQQITLHDHGTYMQTMGPRFETRAEIRMLSRFADVVGMTISSEATLANEAGIEYAVICSVDNYANGIDYEKISCGKIEENQKKSVEKIRPILRAVIGGFA